MTTRTLFYVFLSIFVFVTGAAAQCRADSAPTKVLKAIVLDQKVSSEVELNIRASASQSAWHLPGSEAALLNVFVNGSYSQDIILFAGAAPFDYSALLGRLDKGKHKIELSLDEKRSAKKIGEVTILSTAARPIKPTDPIDALAVANSPFLYIRPDAVDRFSDIPLVTYYEVFPEGPNAGKIRYTTIYSNEDGGTQTAALMARWGRATDIEWTYEFAYRDGTRTSEIYQAANHETKDFTGERTAGEHPLLLTSTVNNNFADRGCSDLKIANLPVRVDLAKRSRESVMDEHPWTYLVMSQEAIREGRVDAARMGANVIDDPRNYLYVDIYAELKNAAVSVRLTSPDGRVSDSADNDPRLRIARSGFQRTAVRLPAGQSDLSDVSIICHRNAGGAESRCSAATVVAILKLDRDYRPKPLQPTRRWGKPLFRPE